MFFQPTARVYFDTGGDDEDEVDIFRNGSINPTIDFAAIYWPWRLGYSEHFGDWSWGPLVGFGIGAPAQDSDDGTEKASSSPVVVFSGGLLFRYDLGGGSSFGFEGGRVMGFTTDESFGDKNDNAWYVGLKISIPTSKQEVSNLTRQAINEITNR